MAGQLYSSYTAMPVEAGVACKIGQITAGCVYFIAINDSGFSGLAALIYYGTKLNYTTVVDSGYALNNITFTIDSTGVTSACNLYLTHQSTRAALKYRLIRL